MRISRIDLLHAVQGVPPDMKRRVDSINARPDLAIEFNPESEVVELLVVTPPAKKGAPATTQRVLIIPRDNVAAMVPDDS